MKKIYPLVVMLGTANVAHAEWTDYLPEPKLKDIKTAPVYVGVGLSNKLAHVNAEYVNQYAIGYVKAGAFWNGENDVGVQAGVRFPVHLNGKDGNGFYIGVLGGQIETNPVAWNDYDVRLGAGIDFSYVKMSDARISTFSVGVLGVEKVEAPDGRTIQQAKPRLQFSYTMSFGL